MLGSVAPFDYLRNFWSDQYEHTSSNTSAATSWDDFAVRGSLQDGKFVRFYLAGGWSRPPSASTAAVIPNGSPTRRWRPAPASWPAGHVPTGPRLPTKA